MNLFMIYYGKLLQMKRGVFWDNHKKYVLWIIDIAKLLAVVGGATLLGILFVKSGFPGLSH